MKDPFLTEASRNHSFREEALDKTLQYLKVNTERHLDQAQWATAGLVNRFDMVFSDAYLEKVYEIHKSYSEFPLRYRIKVPVSFIRTSERSAYKRSEFYNKLLDMETISRNGQLFSTNLLFFVDGSLLTGWQLICREDYTYIYLPVKEGISIREPKDGTPKSMFDSWRNTHAPATLFFIDNMMEIRYHDTSKLAMETLNYMIPKTEFRSLTNLKKHHENAPLTDPMIFLTPTSHEGLYQMQDYFLHEDTFLTFVADDIHDATNVHLRQFQFVNDLPTISKTTDGHGYIELEYRENPVNPDTMMIFLYDERHGWRFAHELYMERHFQSLYELKEYGYHGEEKNPKVCNQKILILPFYRNASVDIHGFIHSDEEFYKIASPTFLMENIDAIQQKYQEFFGRLREPLFYNLRYFENRTDVDGNPLKFKVKTMEELIKRYGWALEIYNHFLDLEPDCYYIDMEGRDMVHRVRMDTSTELRDTMQTVTFDEPHYVFLFHREFTKNQAFLRLFIDGIFFLPRHIYYTDLHTFIYVPTRLVRPNSYIEIERFYEYIWSEEAVFTNTEDKLVFHPPATDRYSIHVNDTFLVKAEGSDYLSHEDFSIEVEMDGEWVPAPLHGVESFLPIGKQGFRIQLRNEDLVDVKLRVNVQRFSSYHAERYNYTIEDEDMIPEFNIRYNGNNDPRHLRVFRNGRIVPMHYYRPTFHKKINQPHNIAIFMQQKQDDEYVVDFTPFKYTQVYYEKEISETGIVDLRGKLERPLNLKWYDIYVNGRRMTLRDIHIITPTRMAIRKHVGSLKNLMIVQKDRKLDYFRLGEHQYLSFVDLLISFREVEQKLISFYGKIEDLEEDALLPLIDEVGILIGRFYRNEMVFSFINPDEEQITDEIIEQYELILDELQNFMINPDHGESRRIMPIIP